MARRKIISDAHVHSEVRRLLAEGGDKAVSFGSISKATGLAGPTLVQRFGSREGMLKAALSDAWDRLAAETEAAEANAPLSAKGAQAFLKALGADAPESADLSLLAADFRDPDLRARAEAWRAQVERALAIRLGGGARGRESASILFSAWQGQLLWQTAGGKSFRVKDALKRLTD